MRPPFLRISNEIFHIKYDRSSSFSVDFRFHILHRISHDEAVPSFFSSFFSNVITLIGVYINSRSGRSELFSVVPANNSVGLFVHVEPFATPTNMARDNRGPWSRHTHAAAAAAAALPILSDTFFSFIRGPHQLLATSPTSIRMICHEKFPRELVLALADSCRTSKSSDTKSSSGQSASI